MAENQNPTSTAESSSTLSPATRRRLQQCYDTGMKSMQAGNFDYATEMFSACVIGDPGNAFYTQGLLANLQRKYNNNKKGGTLASVRSAGAKASLKKASMTKDWAGVIRSGIEVLKLNPWDIPTLLQMAKACDEMGHIECQLSYLRGALDADFKNGEVNRECGRALGALGQYDQAIACWTRVSQASKSGRDEEAEREIANMQVEKTMQMGGVRRDAEAAAAAEEEAQKENPAPAPVKRGRLEQLEEQIAANPGEMLPYAEMAEIYAKEEKWSQAEEILRRGLDATGRDSRLREQLEDVQVRKARQQLLIAEKKAAEEKTPKSQELVGRLKADLNRMEIDVFRSRVERYPTNTNWKYELATRLKLAGNFTEAIKLFQEARTDPKRKGVVQLELGECFQQIKQYSLAMQHYKQAIEEMPEKEPEILKKSIYRAGVLAMGTKQLDEAEKLFNQLAALDFGYRDVSERLDKLRRLRDDDGSAET